MTGTQATILAGIVSSPLLFAGFEFLKDKRTIEFDIAVTAEEKAGKNGKAGLKVLQFAELSGGKGSEKINTSVSRVVFGLNIDTTTRAKKYEINETMRAKNQNRKNTFPKQP